jgi:hypothetical protein
MRRLFADLSQARRQLIKTKALDQDPFLTRLWHYHLHWAFEFLKTAVSAKAMGLRCTSHRLYYRSVDCVFGGNRAEQYSERSRVDAERLNAQVRELRKQQAASEWRNHQLLSAFRQNKEGTPDGTGGPCQRRRCC